ncbi:hypothetical protein PSHT_13666 [Puccinia striiformis]|uniref:Uncharacterized protein n=2 Tax=Puccinia striiformis TaxID=27350 RepID=A0A2S4UPC7_9BASI|nr:hypothetical protein H4Q26_008771 [Puccinia striiformis f. sp. tritici PST-130]KAI9625183.1 hypothetical protein KEM48_008584 [Puccinia striiformis f. sp. tritici PST-130]POV99100.1 hypothetical protein PSHT_13666 [Puccinia striiformis]POW12259.1 hypothetical protein PSTT_04576 [Puccinia striiformis]
MTQASEYQLEQQYDLVLACACLHNINIGKNRYYDIIFDESLAMAEQYKAIYTKDPPPSRAGVFYTWRPCRIDVDNL